MDDDDQVQTLVIPEGFHVERHGNELRVVPNEEPPAISWASGSALLGCLSLLAAFVGVMATSPPLAVGLPVACAVAFFVASVALFWVGQQGPIA